MIRLIFIVFIVFSSGSAFGQTYLGKKFTFSVGTQISPVRRRYSYEDIESTYEGTWFPLRVDLDGRYAINSKVSIGANLNFHGLRNSDYVVQGSGESDYYQYSYIDSFKLFTNARSVGLDLLIFNEYGPIGNHVTIGAGYTSAGSTVYPTLRQYRSYYSSIDLNTVYKLEPWKLNSNFLFLNLGYGATRLLSDKLILEYGVKTSVFFGLDKRPASNYPTTESFDPINYQTESTNFTRRVVLKNLRLTNIAQFYVKFGLTY